MLDFNSSTVSCLWSAQDKVSFKPPETGCSREAEEATGCAGYKFKKKRKSLWRNGTMKDVSGYRTCWGSNLNSDFNTLTPGFPIFLSRHMVEKKLSCFTV